MNNVPGFPVARAAAGDFANLDGGDAEIPFEASKVILRIQVGFTTFRTNTSADVISSSPGTSCTHPRQEASTALDARPTDKLAR